MIERGKIYDWNCLLSEREDALSELEADVEGKLLSKMQVKDIASNSTQLFIATGNFSSFNFF